MNKKYLVLFLITLALTSFIKVKPTYDDFVNNLTSKFKAFHDRPAEKAYLHLTSLKYVSGDPVWFKLYLVDAYTNVPSKQSQITYVDLVDKDNKIIAHQKLKTKNGFADGKIELPENIETGEYVLVAYTNWMRNFGQSHLFTQKIKIFYPPKETPTLASSSESIFHKIDFFPEGGYLVKGLKTVMGFKAVNNVGAGIKVSGDIIDEFEEVKASFTSNEFGIGKFGLQPDTGALFARIFVNDSTSKKIALPKCLGEGLVINVDNKLPQYLEVLIKSNFRSQSTTKNSYLVVQSKGKIHHTSSYTLSGKDSLRARIPKTLLPQGVNNITLFSESGVPIAERVVFIDHKENLNLRITSEKKEYLPREKMTININVTDKNNNPIEGHFSLAVNDSYNTHRENIISYLYLGSEVKGNIENLGFYFKDNNTEDLDNLLLTQGWRRFTWKEILDDEEPVTNYHLEDDLSLRGKLLNKIKNYPIVGGSVTLVIPGDKPSFFFELTSSEGKFSFDDLDITQDQKIFLKAKEKFSVVEDLQILIDSTTLPVYNFSFDQNTSFLSPYDLDFINQSKQRHLINSTYSDHFVAPEVHSNRDTEIPVTSSRSKKNSIDLNYHANRIIDLDDYNSFSSMKDIIKEVVTGVIIREKKGQPRLKVLDQRTKLYFKQEPVYLVDGVPVDDASIMLNLDPSTVKMVTVSYPPDNFYDFGVMGENGVVAVFTTNPNQFLDKTANATTVNFKGFEPAKEFYAPDYESHPIPANVPDFRSLLFWEPNIKTDQNGNASLSFYTSDDVKDWTVQVEGISLQGIPGVGTTAFKTILQQ